MIIGIRKFFRDHWKKLCCSFALFGCIFGFSISILKPKAMEISTENYLSDGEQDFTICNLLLTDNVDTLGFYTDADLHVEFYTSNTSQFVDYIYLADYYVNNSTYVIKKFNINININPSNYLYLTFYFFSDEMEIDYETNCLVYTNVDYYIVQSFDRVYLDNGNNYLLYYSVWLCQVSELTPLRTQNTNLQNQNTQLQNQINDKNTQIELLEDRVGDYQRDNILLQNQIDEMQRDNEDIFNVAYNKGFEEGFDSGEINGFQSGRDEVVADEYYNLTYNDIKSLGFEEGKAWQLANGGNIDNLVFVFVNSMFSSPINILRSYLNWNFFGINLFSLLTSLITLMLVFWVIRFFIGKK